METDVKAWADVERVEFLTAGQESGWCFIACSACSAPVLNKICLCGVNLCTY